MKEQFFGERTYKEMTTRRTVIMTPHKAFLLGIDSAQNIQLGKAFSSFQYAKDPRAYAKRTGGFGLIKSGIWGLFNTSFFTREFLTQVKLPGDLKAIFPQKFN